MWMVEQVLKAVVSDIGIQVWRYWIDVVLSVAFGDVVLVANTWIDTAWDNIWTREYNNAFTWVTF